MERAEMKEAKARVQTVLIDPLVNLVPKRPRKVTETMHEAGLADIRSRLAYLSDDELAAVREAVISSIGRDGAWPSPALILGIAQALRKPPPDDSPMVRSYINSAGPRAYDEGHLVELYRFLKRGRPPQGRPDWDFIRAEAEDGRRERARLRQRLDGGAHLSTDERDILDSYAAHIERAKALLPSKNAGAA